MSWRLHISSSDEANLEYWLQLALCTAGESAARVMIEQDPEGDTKAMFIDLQQPAVSTKQSDLILSKSNGWWLLWLLGTLHGTVVRLKHSYSVINTLCGLGLTESLQSQIALGGMANMYDLISGTWVENI